MFSTTLHRKYQQSSAVIASLMALASLAIKYVHHVNMSTEWWGIVLIITWVITAIACLINLAAANTRTSYVFVLLLAPHVFFFSYEMDGMLESLVLLMFWSSLLISLALELRTLFQESGLSEEVP